MRPRPRAGKLWPEITVFRRPDADQNAVVNSVSHCGEALDQSGFDALVRAADDRNADQDESCAEQALPNFPADISRA